MPILLNYLPEATFAERYLILRSVENFVRHEAEEDAVSIHQALLIQIGIRLAFQRGRGCSQSTEGGPEAK